MDLAQAFFLLKALRENLPATSSVDQKWVDDFHSILDTVEKETGTDLNAFRIQSSDLFHPAIRARRASRHGPGQVLYSNKTVVSRERMLHKLDAVLGYFQYTQSAADAPKPGIGFRK